MGEIIRLRPRQGAKPEKRSAVDADTSGNGSATILLFLGVRYERHDDDSASPAKRHSRRGGRRKHA